MAEVYDDWRAEDHPCGARCCVAAVQKPALHLIRVGGTTQIAGILFALTALYIQ
jgi:hypothetical protein